MPTNESKPITPEDTIAALRENLKAANDLLASLGWYLFGHHADQIPLDIPLEFSTQSWNDTGFPFYERIKVEPLEEQIAKMLDNHAQGLANSSYKDGWTAAANFVRHQL